jgi:multidrug efflux pump subunit AcrA (membrane-fusion protein)
MVPSRRCHSYRASGTLEARNINVGSKEGGRVTRVLASEGDRLEAGQLLVTFDDAELAARVLQARGKLQQAQASLAKMLHGSRLEEIEEAQAAGRLPDGSNGYRADEIAQSQSDLARAKADLQRAACAQPMPCKGALRAASATKILHRLART